MQLRLCNLLNYNCAILNIIKKIGSIDELTLRLITAVHIIEIPILVTGWRV